MSIDVRSRTILKDQAQLTRRETDVVRGIARQLSDREIATALQVKPSTVKFHKKNVYSKLGITRRKQIIESYGSEVV